MEIFLYRLFLVPSASPSNMTAQTLSSTACFVRWGEVPKYERNGFIIGYRLKWRSVGSSEEFYNSTDHNTRNYTLVSLEEATLYEISVWAYNSKGESKVSSTVRCLTFEDGK